MRRMTSNYRWPLGTYKLVPSRILDGIIMWAQGRCILCGSYAWTLADLMDHFDRDHGRVL